MPTASATRRKSSSLQQFSLFLVIIATLLIIISCPASVSGSLSDQTQPSDNARHNAPNALSFSRRGLKNANRLTVSGDLHGNADISGENRPRSASDLILSDVVLVSSIEGGIYGLDRNSGQTRWTLSPRTKRNSQESQASASVNGTTYGGASPIGFGSLVGTSYGPDQRTFSDLANNIPLINETISDSKRRDELATGHEALEALQKLGLYVVDPSAGQVYVLSSSSDSQGRARTLLSKLPLSLPQLVELSPFSFPGDNSRVFAGHKSTSLVEIDVRSGKIGAVFGGQDAGVWCNSPVMQGSDNAECNDDGDSKEEWAYIGRTDYTLTIHLRGRPSLSQTLRFSTFAPNTADRDISTLWSEQGLTLDHRALMGMPEEGTVVCFDAKEKARKQGGKDNTLWISELGATVAGIFDVVYPAPYLSQKPSRPIIVPHPPIPLQSLFLSSPLGADGDDLVQSREQRTLLGVADGQLYAMGSEQYPLVSFSPQAPAGRHGHDGHKDQDHPQHDSTASCASFGCLLGTYHLQSSAEGRISGEGLFDFEVGHAPLLGIGDGKDGERRSTEDSAIPLPSGEETETTPDSHTIQDERKAASLPWSWTPSPMMMMIQIVALLLLAILCGLVYVGAQELQRQRSEDARAVAKDIVWTPRPIDSKELNAEQHRLEEVTHQNADKLAIKVEPPPAPPHRDPEEVARELLQEEAAAKKKPGKRRKRGKRAGAAVQQREAKRDSPDKGEDESGDEEIDEDESARIVPSASTGTLKAETDDDSELQTGWIDTQVDANEQIIKLAAQTSMSAEGGSNISSSSGPLVARGGQSLLISEEVLGYGSSGTIVFKGTFQGRAVAVKRLLRDFVDVASKEVSLLESADNHPNVIRYFYKEITNTFLFIALELCPASLAEIIEKPNEYQELSAQLNAKRALFQIASGLQHLHSLSIVHRDIKPQNILVSSFPGGRLKMLLSDFGLSKRLDGLAQTSFSQTMNNPGGTVGWRAPEILRGDVSLDLGDGSSTTSSTNTAKDGIGSEGERKRLTRAVDIFALGCLTYYVLSNGEHPFGSRYEREMNIIRKQVDLQRLDGLGEEGHEAQHLIMAMIQYEAKERPSATKIMSHPYFWSPARRLAFLQDASDRLDIMEKDPPASALLAIERDAHLVVGNDWQRKIDRQFMEDIGKRRKYDGKSVEDLLRAIRNKKHHIHDLPPNLKRLFGSLPDGFLAYFTTRFPRLFLHTYEVVDSSAILKSEATFASYFVPVSDDV